jgi:hypothetical protein
MAARLIITNGDAAVERLRAAGIEADFLPWRDALHDGPTPGGLILEALSIVRAQFLAKDLGLKLTEITQQFTERNATARNHGQYDRVELWFEHDLYDQLQLIEIIDFMSGEGRKEGLFLAQAGDYLGTLSAEALGSLGAAARPVGAWAFEAARRAWAAFTASTPEALSKLAAAEVPALPHLAPALRRWLYELPAISSGLSLTEERLLGALVQSTRTIAELFQMTQEQEAARFLGDLSFFRRVDGLVFVPQPLISGLTFASTRFAGGGADTPDYRTYAATRVRLTETGRSALGGRFDHASENAINRWFGGTHISPKTMWRRDKDGRLATAPGR